RIAIVAATTLCLVGCGGGGGGDSAPPSASPGPQAKANVPPVISGSPTTLAVAGQPYDFRPPPSDADGDTPPFPIQNLPPWAAFESNSGRLSGTPTSAGSFSNVQISVSDGRASASLPAFTIQVQAAAAQTPPTQPPPAVNHAPTISGTAGTVSLVGQRYLF